MKIYAFYRVPELGHSDTYLYAYTNDKYFARRFQEERNMKLFQLIVKEATMDQYQAFVKTHKVKELSCQGLNTKSKIQYGSMATMEVLSTWEEVDKIFMKADGMIIEELGRYATSSMYLLKEEYLLALEKLEYINIAKFRYPSFVPDELRWCFSGMETAYQGDHIGMSNIKLDEFALYWYFFGWSYK